MPKNIRARKGKDGFNYPYTSPDLVIDKNGRSATTKFNEFNTQLINIVGETIKTVVKEKQITLNGYQTSDKLIENATTSKKYIVLIKDGTTKIRLALDIDPYGNGRSLFSNSHNGYAINETTNSLYILEISLFKS